jgi:REP element-mobilizing transposase RayT
MNEILFAWQPRFFERIIRNEKELNGIRRYIEQNPLKWVIEKNNPDNINYDLL